MSANPSPIDGTDGDNNLLGTPSDDLIRTRNGNDTVTAGAGNDRVNALSSSEIYPFSGNKLIYGEDGDDLLIGASGADWIWGGAGNDTLQGLEGQDTLNGDGGDDFLYGDEDSDSLVGGEGNDTLAGFASGDTARGGAGDDLLYGDAGGDGLFGEEGNDTLSAGAGNDLLEGGLGDDELYGNEDDDWISGDEGHDTLVGSAGADIAFGGIGNDLLYGDEDDDSLSAGDGNDTLNGGTGNDTLEGDTGRDSLIGAEGNDRIDGGNDDDTLIAGSGLDTLIGGAGNDGLFSRSSDLAANIDDGANVADGGDGDDQFVGGLGADSAQGGAGNDTLQGGAGNDLLEGGSGNDSLYGDDGDDRMRGDAGDDRLQGGAGNDLLVGGGGIDSLYGQDGDDTLESGAGSALLAGGAGNDSYRIINSNTRIVDDSGTGDSAIATVDFFKRPSGLEAFALAEGVARLPYWIDGLVPVDASGEFFASLVAPARQMRFTFPQALPSYIEPASDQGAADAHEFSAFSDQQKAATRAVFDYLETIIDLSFIEVDQVDAVSVIALSNNLQNDASGKVLSAGYARYPSESPKGSDVFLNRDDSQGNSHPESGTYGALTLIHEIAHALGLKHPFADKDAPEDSFAVLPTSDETLRWSVMSYNNQATEDRQFWVSQLRPLDIAALHYLYGPSPTTRAGNDVYSITSTGADAGSPTQLSTAQPSFIWDGGGQDRISAEAAGAAVTISLDPGLHGWIGSHADSITAPGQFTINFGTSIESLTGSAFEDRLYGNALDNRIEGGNGNDQLVGQAGSDQLSGGNGTDSLAGGDGNDTIDGGVGPDRMSGGVGDDRFDHLGLGDVAFGGDGIDVASFDAPSTLFRAIPTGSGNSAQWRIEKAEAGWTAVTLSGIEHIVFSDQTFSDQDIASLGLGDTATHLAWHWKTRTVLADSASGTPGIADTSVFSIDSARQSINAADVLAALKMSIGRNPNPSAGQDSASQPITAPVSAYQRLAADLDRDGRVTHDDATRLLDIACGQQSLPDSNWIFVAENADLSVLPTSGAWTGSPAATSPVVVASLPPPTTSHGWIATLFGDVDGSWHPPAAIADARLSEGFVSALANQFGVAFDQWALSSSAPEPAIDIALQLDPLMRS